MAICPITATSYLLGTTFIGLGALGLTSPKQAQLTFGVRPSPATSVATSGAGEPETQAFIISKAGRDIAFGVMLMLFQYKRNKPAVTVVTGLAAVAGFVDALAAYRFAPADLRTGKTLGHSIGATAIMAVAFVRFNAKLW